MQDKRPMRHFPEIFSLFPVLTYRITLENTKKVVRIAKTW